MRSKRASFAAFIISCARSPINGTISESPIMGVPFTLVIAASAAILSPEKPVESKTRIVRSSLSTIAFNADGGRSSSLNGSSL